jgi:ATP-binding cassette subfamily G (WHITE) protein 2 (SNQ2)
VRTLANARDSFVKVDGDVHYSTIDADEAKRLFDGDIMFHSEEDMHTPLLSVEKRSRSPWYDFTPLPRSLDL